MSNLLKCSIEDLVDPAPPFFASAKIMGENVSFEDYAKQTAKRGEPGYIMSRGDLVEFDRCPARWRNGFEDSGSKATEWGQLIDALLLCPVDQRKIAIEPKSYPAPEHHELVRTGKICAGDPVAWSNNAKYCKEWHALQPDKLVVKSAAFDLAQQAMNALKNDEAIDELVANSKRQVMVLGEYGDETHAVKVLVKGLIDLAPEDSNALADFKTCRDAHPRSWQKAVFEHDYHTQAALYLDLWNAATGESREGFRHILQENFSPYQVAKRFLSQSFLSLGREKYRRILKRYCECVATGFFPDYDEASKAEVVVDGWKATEPIDWMVMV